jgi:hypothetical protein
VNRTRLTGCHQNLVGEIEPFVEADADGSRARAADAVNAGVERLFWSSTNR